MTYKSISILKMYSMQVNIGGSEDLPYKAIYTKILSPFTKVLNTVAFLVLITSTKTTPCNKVLRIQRTARHLHGTASIKIYDFEGPSGCECEMPARLLEMAIESIHAEKMRVFRICSDPTWTRW